MFSDIMQRSETINRIFASWCCLILILVGLLPSRGQAAVVEGVVVAERGQLGDATVSAYRSLSETCGGKPVAVSKPGERLGFYRLELPSGEYYLVASGTNAGISYSSFHGANPINVDSDPLWIPFAAVPSRNSTSSDSDEPQLTGVVTYHGEPVSDAQVSLYEPGRGSFKGMGLQTRTTAADGSFRFSTEPGDYLVVARKRFGSGGGMQLSKGDLFCYFRGNPVAVSAGRAISVEIPCYPRDDMESFVRKSVSLRKVRVASARLREKRLELLPGAHTLSGKVVDLEGRPKKDFVVAAYRAEPGQIFQMYYIRTLPQGLATTDAAGQYRLALREKGTYYLVARELAGEAPVKGEYYGLYEGNVDHAVTLETENSVADITVGRTMADNLLRRNATTVSPPKVSGRLGDTVIRSDTIWEGELLIDGRVLVAKGATLTIRPGTMVRFRRVDRDGDGIGDGELRVLGRLVARGTAQAPILFTSAEIRPRMDDWSYLLLFTSGGENIIDYCRFEYAFTGLQAHFSQGVVSNSLFAGNREGIRFGRAELRIEHNDIRDNGCGIRHHRLEGPVIIRYNTISNNDVGIFLVPSGQNTFDFSPRMYETDARYRMSPEIRFNNLGGNRSYNYQLGERQGEDVLLSDNWWGTTAPGIIQEGIFDQSQDSSLGAAEFRPFSSAPVTGAGMTDKGERL